MAGVRNGRGGAGSIGNIAAIALMIVIIVLVSSALLAGPSLEDYWTLHLSDPHLGIESLAQKRWIQDIHPPIFDAWATLLARIGLTSIPIGRLATNLPALLILVYAARRFAKRVPDQSRFYAIFVLLTLSAPATIQAFGVYRGDFWQMAAFAIQLMLARHIMYVEKDYRISQDAGLAVIGILGTLAAITLDYGGALFGGIVAMATMLAAIARGLRRWSRFLVMTLILSISIVMYIISWQGPAWSATFDLYQNWIEMGDSSATGILIALLVGTILHNPVAIAGGYLGRENWTKHDTAFATLMGAALIASLVAVSQVDAQRRLITSSNTADIAVLVTALMAATGIKIADRRIWVAALGGVAILSSILSLAEIGLDGGWQSNAKRITKIVQTCPQTRVYVASGWRLEVGTKSRAAQREERVFALGYKRLGDAHGFTPIMVSPIAPQVGTPGRCPTLLWIEQVPPRTHPKPITILKAVGLKGLDKSKLSIARTESGLILHAER